MIVKHEHVVWRSFGIKDEEFDILSQCWIPKPHQWPYKQCYIAASVRCSTKPDFKLLTYILSVVKTSIHSYCDISSVLLFYSTCSFVRVRQTSQGDFSRKTR